VKTSQAIALSWRSFWTLRKRHDGPGWARLVIASLLALLAWAGLCLLALAGVLTVETREPAFLGRLVGGLLLLFQAIAWTMLAVARTVEWLLPAARLAAISPARDWRSAMQVSAVWIVGAMAGNLVGSMLLALVFPPNEMFLTSALARQLRFLQFLPFLVAVNGIVWRQRLQRQALKAEAAQAQLRLLHAQIEPHFLFNTLASIESLLATDQERARAMLEAFSDHLRAGLIQLRGLETTLGAELDMVAGYLRLLQIRMGERLSFSLDAAAQARAAPVPSLLLQPLVENAVRHGIEPKIGGGRVHVHARIEGGRLRIHVDDDGIGLAAPHAAPRSTLRPGSGMALVNVRERLQHRYGADATLVLASREHGSGGASAVIDLPYQGQA